jgi:transcription antitermination factor NusG
LFETANDGASVVYVTLLAQIVAYSRMAAQELNLYPEDFFAAPETELNGSGERLWWVVYTKSRQEKAFSRQLIAKQIPHYLPLVKKTYVSCGRRFSARVPLFPGYVFMFGSEQERVVSLTTNRVSRILGVPDPARLRADLEQVQRLIETGAPLTVEQRLAPGNHVRIRHGAMAGVEGTVLVRRGKTRLIVAVTLLQQGVSVELDDYTLEPID